MKVFLDNREKVLSHNARFANGEVTFELGMNKFGDLLSTEFAAMYNGYTRKLRTGTETVFMAPENFVAPTSVDWRTEGAVTPVKNQGACGSCWAFSTTGSLEGQHFKKTGELISLSEQQLVDCSTDYGNYGCDGGIMEFAFMYIADIGGITTEDEYPYMASEGYCLYDDSMAAATVSDFQTIRRGSEHDLEAAVSEIGPISVAIDAGHRGFQMYKHGVYHSLLCSNTRLNHAVLAVGYGSEGGDKYWLVKNSWGATWGDHGYIKMSRGRNNNCGIASQASFPVV